jgi:PAS domain S-box-containing protein
LLTSETEFASSRVQAKVGVADRLTTTAALALLRESESRSQILLHSNVTEALYLLDPDGNIETWNLAGERIKGYTATEIIGRNFAVFFPPEDIARGEPARVLAAAWASGQFTAEGWRVRKDGSRFMARVAIDPIRRDDGTLRGFVKVTRDITTELMDEARRQELSQTLARARNRAEEASQAKSRFLATITHDLRTPLHGILGYIELLFLDGGLGPTQSKRLEAMTAAGQCLLGTINSVLDMSQIEADRLELQPVGFELHELIRTCFDVVRPKAEAKGLDLVLAPADTPLHLYADPMRLQQVVINLLGNAVKFTPTGSVQVRLQPSAGGEGIRLEVADTGPGIWERHRDKLFQTFERLNAKSVSHIEGSGLGLAIAARLVNLMGGQIGYADNPGGGSVFWVELPRGTGPSAEVVGAAPSLSRRKPRLRILVVDDEAMNRSIASGFLSTAGHDVVCVDSGTAAVEAVAAADFDAVLMDVRMPVMDGLEATRRIRALPAPRGAVRVVAVTAQAFVEQIERCRHAGMDGHVSKPFKQAVLLAALENVTKPPNDTGLAVEPPASAGFGSPILDRAAFDSITAILSPADLAKNLQLLITWCEALLRGLRGPGMVSRAGELAEAAHKLAGGGGAFGFWSVTTAARQFEWAVESGAADSSVLADGLGAAIEASLPTMRECKGRIAA